MTLFLMEFALMTLWFYIVRPESESSIDVFWVVPVLFGINLLIGIILYFIKKPIGLIFLGNSIFCPYFFRNMDNVVHLLVNIERDIL